MSEPSIPHGVQPMWTECLSCGHRWVAAYIPMDLTKFARLARNLHCPRCAETAENIVIVDPEVTTSQPRPSEGTP